MIKPTKKSEIEKKWHLVDAKGQVLGRLASGLSPLLMGKNKSYFTKNLDCGDHVVLINAKEILVTGKKSKEKQYYSYSGYPGGLSKTSFPQLIEKHPEKIIQRAVLSMLPKNKLRSEWLNRLHVFPSSEHSFKEKFVIKTPKKGKNENN